MFLGAITVSYNLPGVKIRPEARRQDDRQHLPRQDQDLERPRNQGAEPGRQPAEHGDHGHPPLGLLGHDLRLHQLPVRGRPRMEEQGRRRQDRAVADGHRRARATRAWPAPCSRRPARSATSSRPTRWTHNFTVASVKNKAGNFVEPSLASTSAAGEGVTVPANLGIKVINSPDADGLPDHLADVHRRQQGPLQGRHPRRRSGGQGRREVPEVRARRRPVDPRQGRLRGAAGLDPGQVRRSGRRAAVQRHARSAEHDAAAASPLEKRPWRQHRFPAGERSILERSPLARLPDRALKYGLTVLAALILALIVYFFIRLFGEARPAFAKEGVIGFVFGNDWNVSAEHFGALPLLVGTLITSIARAADRRPRGRRDRDLRDRAVPPAAARVAHGPGRAARGRAVGRLWAVGHLLPGPQAATSRAVGRRPPVVHPVHRRRRW